MRNRIVLLGSALIGAALLCGPAAAQSYDGPYEGARYYDERPAPPVESVIVRPDYEYIEKQHLIGNINGEHNPTAFTISRPVEFSDLNLTDPTDRRELRARVRDTAEDFATSWMRACPS